MLDRLIKEANKLGSIAIRFRNHTRVAKRRNYQIFNAKGRDEQKVDLYDDLIKITATTMSYFNLAHTEVAALEINDNEELGRNKKRWL